MVIDFDKQHWQQGTGGHGESAGRVRPDWHGLQARLLAARDARAAFAAGASAGSSRDLGSFDGMAARRMVAFGLGSAFVNPNDSANRNAEGVNETHVADETENGERG